jgi:hypothetical protein
MTTARSSLHPLGLATIIAVLGTMAVANVALANEFTPGQICQVNTTTTDHSALTLSYGWVEATAPTGAYAVCPMTRTYSSVSSAKAYIYNPTGQTTSGYINFVNTDDTYTNYNYASTTTVGNTSLTFTAISNPSGLNGFVNFEMFIPANGGVYGFYSN